MGIAYRPEIDGLRAIAVLAVVAYHAGLGGAGFVGVDVFFVISGYLITALLLREQAATGRIDLLDFYARRVRRILPAAAVVTLAVLGGSILVLGPAGQAHVQLSAGAALVFGANVFFQYQSGGYFDGPSEEMPLLHLWSLSVEEQFYFLWPALLLVLLRWGLGRPGIVVLGLASLVLAEWLVRIDPQAAFYQMPARFWELAAGGFVAALPARRLPGWVGWVGIVVVVAACLWPAGSFPGLGALPAVLGAALVVWAVHGGQRNAFLGSRPMVWVGLISYSLYLWHWPLLAFYRATTVGEGSLQTRLLLCAVAFPLAVASYRYVEQPIRRMRWPKGRTVALGFGISAVIALSACMVGLRDPVDRDDPFPLATVAERDMPRRTCHSAGMDDATVRCRPAPETRVALWGDSMAYAWAPLAWQADRHASVMSRDACGPFLDWMPVRPMPGDLKCRDFNETVSEAVKGLETLVVVARWQPERLDAFPRTLERLAPHVGRVVVLGPTPELRDRVPVCLRSGDVDGCAIPRAEFDAVAKPVLAKLRAAAASYPNVEVIDLTDRFCTSTSCPPVLDGMHLYWDSHHVSSTKVRSFDLDRLGVETRTQR